MRIVVSGCFAAVLGLLVSGCGSDNKSGASCSSVTACGGDIVGTWQIDHVCLPPPAVSAPSSCPTATISVSGLDGSGTFVFGADGSLQNTLSVTFTETVTFPPSCISEAQCASAMTQLGMTTGVTSATCSYAAGSGCSCVAKLKVDDSSSGSYKVSGSNVTFSSPGSADSPGSYCVVGTKLNVQSTQDGQTATFSASR